MTEPRPPHARDLLQAAIDALGPGEELDREALYAAHPEVADELRAMVADWDALQEMLGAAAPAPGDPSGDSAPRLSDLAETAGAARYEERGAIGQGGMGIVLEVWDRQLERPLAKKVLRDGVGSSSEDASPHEKRNLARFLDEARVTGQLDHPGIVPVHELGIDEAGRAFFTMRKVEGLDLDEVFLRVRAGDGEWTVTRVLGSLLRACEAMAFAHSRGVIHRDLKPANIMVGRFGEVVVMDWGLARVLAREDAGAALVERVRATRHDADSDSPWRTMDGEVMGTPAYMSPEQARGEVEGMGPSSDVYSMGAILYQLFAGRRPYEPAEGTRDAMAIWAAVQRGAPEPLDRLARGTPPELVAICEKAMSRAPADRYADMQALAEDLRAFLEGRVVRAHRTGAVVELRKWVARNKGLAAAIAATLVVAVGGLAAVSMVRGELNADLVVKNREAEVGEYLAGVRAAEAQLGGGSQGATRALLDGLPEHLRSWEWSFLHHRADTRLAQSAPLPAFPFAVACDPRGEVVAVGGGPWGDFGDPDAYVQLLRATDLAPVGALEGHPLAVRTLCFAPSGETVFSAGLTGVLMHDRESGDVVGTWHVPGQTVRDLAVLERPDAPPSLLIGMEGGDVFELFKNQEPRTLVKGSDPPRSLTSLGTHRDALALGYRDGGVDLWIASEGTSRVLVPGVRVPIDGERDWKFGVLDGELDWQFGVLDLSFSSDGSRLLAATSAGEALLLELDAGAPGSEPRRFVGHGRPVTAARFGPRDQSVVTAGLDGTVRLWSLDGTQQEVLHGHGASVTSLDVDRDRGRIVTTSFDRTVGVWDAEAGSAELVLRGAEADNFRPHRGAFDPRGEKLAWSQDARTLAVSDARSGLMLYRLRPFLTGDGNLADGFTALAFSPDGGRLYTSTGGSAGGWLRAWDAETGQLLETMSEPLPQHVLAAFDLVGGRFAHVARAAPGGVRILDLERGETLRTIELDDRVAALAFTPDGGRLVLGLESDGIRVHDVETGALALPPMEMPEAFQVAVSPDGRTLAAISYVAEDRALWLWDLTTGALHDRLEATQKPASVCWSPDGRRVLTGNWYAGTVSVWDPDFGHVVDLGGNVGVVRRVVASPAGRVLSMDSSGNYLLREVQPVGMREAPRATGSLHRELEPLAAARLEEFLWTDLVEARVRALRADTTLDDAVRAVAIRLARCEPLDPRFLQNSTLGKALIALLDPDLERAEYEAAWRVAEACKADWAEEDPWVFQGLEGFYLHRVGELSLAGEALDRARENPRAEYEVGFPTGWENLELFLALNEAAQGSVEDARDRRARLLEQLDLREYPARTQKLDAELARALGE